MMTWQARYLSALHARDTKEQAIEPILSRYTTLADRLADELAAPQSATEAPLSRSPHLEPRETTLERQRPNSHVNTELAEAQRARASLEARGRELTLELGSLKANQKIDQKRIQELTHETSALAKKIRDRDEELREKSRLLDDVHNETVALTIQLNVSEESNTKLKMENKELVDRWMARMGQEADAMNDASNFK